VPSSRRTLVPRLVPRLAPLLAATAAGCAGDPFGPAPSDPGPRTQFSISVSLLDAGDTLPVSAATGGVAGPAVRVAPAPGLLVVSGQLWPGKAAGRPRRVTDGRVGINGIAVAPTTGADGYWRYALEVPMPRSSGTVVVTLPQVDGVRPPSPTLRLDGVARDPHDESRVDGDALRLRVTPPTPDRATAVSSRTWWLALDRGTARARVQSTGEVPPVVVVPVGGLLPGAGPIAAALQHRVFASSAIGQAPSDTTYGYDATLYSSLRWPVIAPGDTP
jgi:hypothetical protein